MITIFWICLLLVAYTFVGYGLLLFILVKLKRIFVKIPHYQNSPDLPSVTVMIAAYNEEDLIIEKVNNTLALDYPKDRLQLLFITDGSTDRTVERLRAVEGITLLHEDKRAGKMAAIKRAIPFIRKRIR